MTYTTRKQQINKLPAANQLTDLVLNARRSCLAGAEQNGKWFQYIT